MKTTIIYTLILLLIAVFFSSDSSFVSAENQQQRIRFQITTINESGTERKVLAQTTVEGLPGTDFNVNLQTGNFKMQARFLSDLVTGDKLKIRAELDTRRFYGFSPANLPLYEEDSQKQILETGFDETIVLLPFGRNGGAETLKIEITPALLSVPKKSDEAQKLTINFDKPIPSGEINVEAFKIPHHFTVEAVLLADGRAIAKGNAQCLLEEEKEIALKSLDKLENQNFAAKLTIDKFSRNRPTDLVGINFDFYRAEPENQIQQIISGGAGIGLLGGDLSYPLKNMNLPGNKNYELKFNIRLIENEGEN